jgi:TolB protein
MQFFYTIRSGESLHVIAGRRGIPLSSLIAANGLTPPYTIYPGQQLSMPPGVDTIRVKAGDTLYQIAQFYGIPLNLLIEANRLQPPYLISVGQVLAVPRGVPYYVVQPGDSLYLIAQRFHVTTMGQNRFDLIQRANGLPSTNITPGMRLQIPYAPTGETGWIAYTTDRGGDYDIWLYRPLDGSTHPLTQGLGAEFSTPYWSPDSQKIGLVGKNQIVYVVDVGTGAVAQIDQVEPSTLLSFSPNSQFLTYVKGDQIVIYNLTAHSSQRIQQSGASDAQWFPSGQELLFAAPDSAGTSQLYRVMRDGTNKKQLTQNTNGPLHNVRLSPNGAFALYTSPGASISLITTVELATGKTVTLAGGPLSKNYYPEWAPDSIQIVYSATFYPNSGYYSFIETDRPTGGEIQTWAIADCFGSPVTWSPSGNQIAYLSGCNNVEKASQVWIVSTRDSVPILAIQGGHISALQWSPRVEIIPSRRVYTNQTFHVTFTYPANWSKVNEERYEGTDGFFQIAAIAGGNQIREVCHSEAFHVLRPYGSQPRIVNSTIKNQEACFIYPSADQPKEMKNQAALIVRYPQPVSIQGTTYNYFILWADQLHIGQIAQELSFF